MAHLPQLTLSVCFTKGDYYTVRPNKKETRKSSYFTTEIESLLKYSFHCYKVQFIFFHLTPKMSCNAHAWPSKNNVKFQCQNQVAQNKWVRSVRTAYQMDGSLALVFHFVPLSYVLVRISLWEWLHVLKEWKKRGKKEETK